MHDALVAEGAAGHVGALAVGAQIEDLDIKAIADMRARTRDEAAVTLYDNLQYGSRNHLRAFVSQLDSRGETYEPRHISRAEFVAIIGGAHERCGK